MNIILQKFNLIFKFESKFKRNCGAKMIRFDVPSSHENHDQFDFDTRTYLDENELFKT